MYPVLLHALILVYMLRAERMVLAQDYSHAQQRHRRYQKPYYHYNFHARISARRIYAHTFCGAKILHFSHIRKFFYAFFFFLASFVHNICIYAKFFVPLHAYLEDEL